MIVIITIIGITTGKTPAVGSELNKDAVTSRMERISQSVTYLSRRSLQSVYNSAQ